MRSGGGWTGYASPEEQQERIRLARAAWDFPLILDIKGPQLRVEATGYGCVYLMREVLDPERRYLG